MIGESARESIPGGAESETRFVGRISDKPARRSRAAIIEAIHAHEIDLSSEQAEVRGAAERIRSLFKRRAD